MENVFKHEYESDFGRTIVYRLRTGAAHREDGPALIYKDGRKLWFKYGNRHRLDGPAVITGENCNYWFINDHNVTDKIYKWAEEMNIDLDNLSDEDKMLIRIYWENYEGE